MKKLLASLFATLLLVAGCSGGGGSSSGTKVCTVDESVADMAMEIEIKEEDGKVGKLTFKAENENDLYKEMSDDDLKAMEDQMNESLSQYDGIKMSSSIDGNVMKIEITMDIQKLDELPREFNMTGSDTEELKNMKFDDFVKEMEDAGAKCK
ncbi:MULTISPECIES: hypothetical protein [unclassified Breznakia]|uniref:hypothetical protein n=1 Tax=unclassified Breznakia TaxID=2623764 RepID=UPI0024064DA0|nr:MULTISPECIES: hypothetical protein [unclassified Breznakia]MDF9837554.1 hypothetical protein [Breznakia sp. PFB2-8]MDF9860554.1 hypothetical protein [Breznakia sp. PH5-24]